MSHWQLGDEVMQKANFLKFSWIENIENFFAQRGQDITSENVYEILRSSFETQETIKSKRNQFMHHIAKFILIKSGWKMLTHEIPELDKVIFVLGHHTSRMDFVWSALAKWYLNTPALILVSAYYFRNNFLRRALIKLGVGPLINTGYTKNQAEQLVQLLNQTKQFRMAICPEGSLGKKNYWHKGFYYIAAHSNAHILPVKINYAKKEIGFGEPFLPTDVKNDMDKLREFYKDSVGKYPELQTEIRLKNENSFRKIL